MHHERLRQHRELVERDADGEERRAARPIPAPEREPELSLD
jgi:hypothetical protein